IGSQITDLGKMETAFRILSDFVTELRADGHNISHIDFGGGLGIPYHMDREAPPLPSAYAAMVKRVTHNLGCTLMFEPGRMTVGAYGAVQSGFYNTRPLVPEVLVKDDQYAVVRPRIDVEALIAMDKPAPWL